MKPRTSKQQPVQPLFAHEIEREVLGALLMQRQGAHEAVAGLNVDDFTGPGAASIFAAIRHQIGCGQDADVLAVFERLRASGDEDENLLVKLNDLAQASYAAPSALQRAAQHLNELSQRRVLIAAAQNGTLSDALQVAEEIKAGVHQADEIEVMPLGHMLNTDPTELDFVLPGLLAGTVGMLVSSGATGKTMLATQLGALVACGADTLQLELGHQPSLGRVVYLTGEDPREVMHRRLYSVGRHLSGKQRQLLEQNLVVANLIGRGADIFEPTWQARVKTLVTGARLVVLDTLRRFHSGDENDSGEMARLLSALECLCRDAGTTILCLHHTSKSGARDGAGEQQAARGSSVLTDNARLQINLATMTEAEGKTFQVDEACRRSFVRLIYSKVNYAAAPADRWLRRGPGGVLELAHFGRAGVAVATMNSAREGGMFPAVSEKSKGFIASLPAWGGGKGAHGES